MFLSYPIKPRLKPNKGLGMSLIEVIITLAVISAILAAATMYYGVNQAKYRLDRTSNQVLNLMLHAQTHASLNNEWTRVCFIQDETGSRMMTMPHPNFEGLGWELSVAQEDPTEDGFFTPLKVYDFEQGVTFCKSDSDENTQFCSGFIAWGSTHRCLVVTPQGFLAPGQNASEKHMWTSVCIISSDINEQAQSAREIEFTQGGILNLVPRGEAGVNTTVDSRLDSPVMTAGEGQCSSLYLPT